MMQTTPFYSLLTPRYTTRVATQAHNMTKTNKAVRAPPAPSALPLLPLLPLLLPLPIPSLLRSSGFERIVLRVCVGAHTRSAHIPGKEQEAKRQRGKEAK